MFLASPVGGPRIVPKLKPRSSVDVLPNNHPGFRVTQGYYDLSEALGGKRHQALDFANYYSGDHLYASHAGRIVNKRDPYGAMIVEITGNDGWVTGYAHLSRFAQLSGGLVGEGWLIGYVGSTGLSASAHCHFYRRAPNGTLVDPWSLLVQNRPARINVGVNIRKGPGINYPIYGTTTPTAYREAYTSGWSWVTGGWHGIQPFPNQWRKLWINGAFRYVARPLVTIL